MSYDRPILVSPVFTLKKLQQLHLHHNVTCISGILSLFVSISSRSWKLFNVNSISGAQTIRTKTSKKSVIKCMTLKHCIVGYGYFYASIIKVDGTE